MSARGLLPAKKAFEATGTRAASTLDQKSRFIKSLFDRTHAVVTTKKPTGYDEERQEEETLIHRCSKVFSLLDLTPLALDTRRAEKPVIEKQSAGRKSRKTCFSAVSHWSGARERPKR